MDWKKLLAYITGSVDQELLLRNESLAAENCILRNQIHGRVRLTDGDRRTLVEIGNSSASEHWKRQGFQGSVAEILDYEDSATS